jgi:hypothetical protein
LYKSFETKEGLSMVKTQASRSKLKQPAEEICMRITAPDSKLNPLSITIKNKSTF